MPYILSIDPGMSTGIVLGEYGAETPYSRIAFWQIEGGLPGLRKWLSEHYLDGKGYGWWFFEDSDNPYVGIGVAFDDVHIVCEKFSPLPMARSFKLEELEPIRIEGVIEDRFEPNVTWQRPPAMVLDSRPDTTAKRKQASDNVLREMGLWTTGKQVGLPDSNDVNSAQKHAVAYLRNIGHQWTIDQITEATS